MPPEEVTFGMKVEEPNIPLMELCGTQESVSTPVGPESLPVSSCRHPPSPFSLSITPIEVMHTPHNKSESPFVTATPSPALNPLAQDYWSQLRASTRNPILCPGLGEPSSHSPRKGGTLRMRPASLPVSRETLKSDALPPPPACHSTMQRTHIYQQLMAEGQELSLNYSDEDDDPLEELGGLQPQQRSNSTYPFTFADVLVQQSSFENEHMAVEPTDSMLAMSFYETLDEWCTDDTCTLDLTDVSGSLKGIFYMLGAQKPTESLEEDPSATAQHVRVNSTDLPLMNSCMTDFLSTPASIWADLPSTAEAVTTSRPTPGNTKLIRNRAFALNSQARRWRQLQAKMTFASVVQSAQSKMTIIATTKSMDDFDRSRNNRIGPNLTKMAWNGLYNLFGSSLNVDDDINNKDDDCDYYDSDPEDARLQTRNQGPRRVLAERLNKIEKEEIKIKKKLDFSLRDGNFRSRRFDEAETQAIIEIMKSEQIPLLWHPTPTQKHPNQTTQCVTAWVERGTYLVQQSFVQPKWMWMPAQELNLDTRRLNISTESPQRVDLLEITRLIDSPNIDRHRYPLVRKRRCFTVETKTDVFVFEAQSAADKKRIVLGLKLTISRLASLIMTHDPRAVEEFFEPVHEPGKPPEWEWAK